MYEDRFGLSGSPFRLNPDPKFFFGSRSHNKAMAYLHYGLRQGEGFIVITGEIGAGKSMLIGHLLDQLDRSNIVAANLPTTNLEPSALVAHVLSAFRIEPSGSGKSAEIEALEDYLFDQMNRGRRVLLIVDEAQNLPLKTIEELRMLSNMDYDGTPLFQVFLIGQPEFRATLAKPDMEQLRQRVIATYHLNPLDADETRDYVVHRLDVVGWNDNPSIAPESFAAIHAATGGLPRKINTLCNRIFLYCAIENVSTIDESVVAAVVADMASEAKGARRALFDESAAEPLAPAAQPDAELRALNTAPGARNIDAPQPELPERDHVQSARASLSAMPVWTPPRASHAVAPVPVDRMQPAAPDVVVAPPLVGPSPLPSEMRHIQMVAPMTTAFDRLRGLKSGAPAPSSSEPPAPHPLADHQSDPPAPAIAVVADAPPEPATLGDVADAIKKVGDFAAPPSQAAATAPLGDVNSDHLDDGDQEPADDLPMEAAAPAWRQSILKSIAETRDDLKTAHANVTRLRRRLIEIDRRRVEKRDRVSANLDKAETILAEIRNVWR